MIISGLTLLQSCGGNSKPHPQEPENKETNKSELVKDQEVDDFALVEPIKKFIYYMNEVDISTYDSISTQYFHEVLDYTDSVAIALDKKREKLQVLLNMDTTAFEKELATEEIADISMQLNQYQKEVTGYVFVHTFLNKGDTLSAIIITNADMSKGQAHPVATVSSIEPTAFTNDVRQIDHKKS